MRGSCNKEGPTSSIEGRDATLSLGRNEEGIGSDPALEKDATVLLVRVDVAIEGERNGCYYQPQRKGRTFNVPESGEGRNSVSSSNEVSDRGGGGLSRHSSKRNLSWLAKREGGKGLEGGALFSAGAN